MALFDNYYSVENHMFSYKLKNGHTILGMSTDLYESSNRNYYLILWIKEYVL